MASTFSTTAGLIKARKAVTPTDGEPGLNNAKIGNFYPQAFWCATAGDVTVVDMGGNTVTYPTCIAGMWHNVPPFKQINDTNTTATALQVGTVY